MRTRLEICCIASLGEALLAAFEPRIRRIQVIHIKGVEATDAVLAVR